MTELAALTAAARAWQRLDPDPETRAEVDRLLETGDVEALERRFGTRLAFGTAGLRGELGAGPNRMNRVVVTQTSAGLGAFLTERSAAPTAVIGYDARRNSAVFARDTAEVLSAAGVAVTLLPRALPTPVLAFAVRDLGASAGVMITASHNPAADNGYKLYLGGADGGSQLVSPADTQVQGHIDRVVESGRMPARATAYAIADETVVDRYVAATAAIAVPTAAFPWVYTPMHGVGAETALRVVAHAGLPAPVLVAAQREPDPDFPTVSFPNPEEPGALDLAVRTANGAGARLILANDPDADRLAVAIPVDDGWRRLSGNEVGMLLAWSVAAAGPAGGTFATSIVSTPGLAAIAAHFGFESRETLTGFKWISRVPGLRFGFEEALGYLVNPDVVHDKDGISALVAVLRDVLTLHRDGRTLADRLDEIAMAVGAYASAQVSVRVTDLGRIDLMMARLRAAPPETIGGLAVLAADDLLPGIDGLPASDALRYTLESGARVIVRPSGTEPKLKVYLDAVADSGILSARTAAAAATIARLQAGVAALLD